MSHERWLPDVVHDVLDLFGTLKAARSHHVCPPCARRYPPERRAGEERRVYGLCDDCREPAPELVRIV